MAGADPVAVAVARVAAARWIVVPFAPVQLAVASGAATEPVDQADQSAAAVPEAAARLRAAATLAPARCRTAAALLSAMAWTRAAANRWTAFGTARPRLTRKRAAVDGVAFARWIAAATSIATATHVTTAATTASRITTTNAQHPKQVGVARRRRGKWPPKQDGDTEEISHLSRSLALGAGRGESGEAAE